MCAPSSLLNGRSKAGPVSAARHRPTSGAKRANGSNDWKNPAGPTAAPPPERGHEKDVSRAQSGMVPRFSGARIVPRPMLSLSSRCALAAALALALGLGGCGRKGALDPPPGGLADPTVIGTQPAPPPGPDGQVAA